MPVVLRRPSPGRIASPFGPRAGGHHDGIDFGWGNGWTITAAASGVVRWAAPGAGYGARYGNLTIIDHGGFETRYAHQSRIDVRVGQQVKAGDAIGVIGGSGANGPNSYDPHLHFELLIGSKRVNPAPYFTSTAGGGTPLPAEQEQEQDDDMKMLRWGHYNDGGRNRFTLINYATGRIWQTYSQDDANNMAANLGQNAEQWSPQLAANLVALMGIIGPQAPSVDVPALASALAPLLPKTARVDEAALVTALTAALEPQFAKVNANIDDQPTVFKVTPN